MKKILALSLLTIFIFPSCITANSPVEKRIKKQKRRQKRNPNDCPKIDC